MVSYRTGVEARPRRRASSVIDKIGRQSVTDWGSGVAAVYDGDDWQEKVADIVIGFVCPCRKSPAEAEEEGAFVQQNPYPKRDRQVSSPDEFRTAGI